MHCIGEHCCRNRDFAHGSALTHATPAGATDLATAKPLARCTLQIGRPKKQEPEEEFATQCSNGPARRDPLSNYERTSLGDWPMWAAAERKDPWSAWSF